MSMRKLLVPALAAGALLLATPLPSLADSDLPDIRPHRHFIVTPGGGPIEVGPRVCDTPSLQAAFNQFHANVHHGAPTWEGPEAGAPGLDNGMGADIVSRPCS